MRGTIRPPVDVSRLILGQLPEVRKLRRQFATIADAWMTIVPEALAAQTRLESVSRGILNVKVPNAAIRFELDRFLRSGGEAKLLASFPLAIRRIRIGLEVGPDAG